VLRIHHTVAIDNAFQLTTGGVLDREDKPDAAARRLEVRRANEMILLQENQEMMMRVTLYILMVHAISIIS
jgi:hypothetical protein